MVKHIFMTEMSKEEEGQGDTNSKVFYELQGLESEGEDGGLLQQIFPKVDPYLVTILLYACYQDPIKNKNKGPMYTLEVFTKVGTDSQKCKDHISNYWHSSWNI